MRRSTPPTALPTVRAALPAVTAANCAADGVRPSSCGSARPTARLILAALSRRHLADRRARGTEAVTARVTGRAEWAKWVGPVTWQWSLYFYFFLLLPFLLLCHTCPFSAYPKSDQLYTFHTYNCGITIALTYSLTSLTRHSINNTTTSI